MEEADYGLTPGELIVAVGVAGDDEEQVGEAVLGPAPNDLSGSSSSANPVGADTVTVAITHTVRVTFIVILAPLMVTVV